MLISPIIYIEIVIIIRSLDCVGETDGEFVLFAHETAMIKLNDMLKYCRRNNSRKTSTAAAELEMHAPHAWCAASIADLVVFNWFEIS